MSHRPGGEAQTSPMRESPEFERIRRLVEATSAPSVPELVIGPGDDAAVLLSPSGESLVLSTDMSVEGVHFRREWLTWDSIGYRSAAAALSDLAAMGARPIGVLLSLAVPPEMDERTLAEMAGGIGACLRETGGALLGGDLSRSAGSVVLDFTAVGAVDQAVTRSGARPGDELFVTGTLGGAASATAAWEHGLEPDPAAKRAFERPRPRIREARRLCERHDVHALIDLSDGLASDAAQMAAASGVRLVIETDRIPLHPGLEGWALKQAALALAVGGGEDYELLAAVAPGDLGGSSEPDPESGVGWCRIGCVTEGEGVDWLGEEGRSVDPPAGGFDHFAEEG